ncbi:hypothetical protein DW085_10460 [Clostridium sp. AF50-3]|nr:hypothetical protein DW085_10460 [Clostridium sp. AF50-3]
MILLTKDKTRAKRPGLFLTKKCYPQKKHDTTANPICHAKGISVLQAAKMQRFNAAPSPY